MVFPDHTACTDPGNIVGERVGGGGGGFRPIRHKFFQSSTYYSNLRFFLKKTIIFQDSREGPTFSEGVGVKLYPGRGGVKYKNPNNVIFLGVGSDPLSPSGSSHENSLFRCFAQGLKMCMSCALDPALDIIVKSFSLSLFYELVIQFQVDICILDTILMFPEFDPESGALATVGEFVLCVTMT